MLTKKDRGVDVCNKPYVILACSASIYCPHPMLALCNLEGGSKELAVSNDIVVVGIHHAEDGLAAGRSSRELFAHS